MQEYQSHRGRTRDQHRPPREPGARMQATGEPAGHANLHTAVAESTLCSSSSPSLGVEVVSVVVGAVVGVGVDVVGVAVVVVGQQRACCQRPSFSHLIPTSAM
eukprot:4827705-Pyramimonas_sp.AAC.1